jgi:hypothetical protein
LHSAAGRSDISEIQNNPKMKTLILLTCMSIVSQGLFAQHYKKVKKELIETIKKNYDSWIVQSDLEDSNSDELDGLSTSPQFTDSSSSVSYQSNSEPEKHTFSEFAFKICETQAVVRFQVDYQEISAFMEKKNGKWALVCAAVVLPNL